MPGPRRTGRRRLAGWGGRSGEGGAACRPGTGGTVGPPAGPRGIGRRFVRRQRVESRRGELSTRPTDGSGGAATSDRAVWLSRPGHGSAWRLDSHRVSAVGGGAAEGGGSAASQGADGLAVGRRVETRSARWCAVRAGRVPARRGGARRARAPSGRAVARIRVNGSPRRVSSALGRPIEPDGGCGPLSGAGCPLVWPWRANPCRGPTRGQHSYRTRPT